ncbi:MAG: hypothetical protein HRT77_01275 [Halioglobus sp.]|nr:hypothetical protein [Halioglobus sp.]
MFIHYTAAPQVRSDVWRHLHEIVIPFLEGRDSAAVLWTNHHPSPLLHLIQIANLKWFDLRLDLDAYLGFFFQFFTVGLLLAHILSTTHSHNDERQWPEAIAGLLTIAVYLGFNVVEQYSWPLLTTVQYLYFFAIILYLSIDRCVATGSVMSWIIVASVALFFMFANADFGSVFLASAAAALVLVFSLERRSIYLNTALAIIAAWAAYHGVLWYLEPNPWRPPHDTWSALLRMVTQPLTTATQYGLALAWGLADIGTLRSRYPELEPVLVTLAPLLTLAMLVTFLAYCLKKCYRRSLVPLMLMLSPATFAVSLYIFRSWVTFEDIWGLAQMRYAPTWKLAIVGMLWALWILAKEQTPGGRNTSRKIIAGSSLTMVMLLLIQIWQIHLAWNEKANRKRNGNNHDALGIYLLAEKDENNFEPNILLHAHPGADWVFQDTLDYLKLNNLNVFSANYPESPLLDRHVESRNAFLTTEDAIIAKPKDGWQQSTRAIEKSPIKWALEENRFTLKNNTNTDAYVSITLNGTSNRAPHNSVWVSTDRENYRVRIYKGTVVLYFTAASNDQLQLHTPTPNRIDRIEIRSPGNSR